MFGCPWVKKYGRWISIKPIARYRCGIRLRTAHDFKHSENMVSFSNERLSSSSSPESDDMSLISRSISSIKLWFVVGLNSPNSYFVYIHVF